MLKVHRILDLLYWGTKPKYEKSNKKQIKKDSTRKAIDPRGSFFDKQI